MAVDLGKGYVQIIPSAKGIGGAISDELNGAAGKAGKTSGLSIVGGIKGILMKAAIGGTIVAGIKKSISEGADLEQSIGGIETLFKKSAKTVIENSKTAYKRAGMSANEYMENVTSFSASLISSVGGNTKKAAKSADMALVDMSDNANKFGSNIQDIEHAYQGFAKQNYTMLDNLKLGYGGTKSEMERLLADAEKISGQKYDISNLNDVYNAIHIIQKNLGITGTTAKEAATTLSGSFGMMKNAFTDLMGNLALGRDIGKSVKNLIDATITFLAGNLAPAIGRILLSLPTVIIQGIAALLPYVEQGVNQLLEGIKNGSLMESIMNVWNSNMKMLTENGGLLLVGGRIIGKIIEGIILFLPQLWDAMINNVINLSFQFVDAVSSAFEQGFDVDLTTKAQEMFGGFVASVQKTINVAVLKISVLSTKMFDAFFKNLPQGFKVSEKIYTNLSDGIAGAIDKLTKFEQVNGDKMADLAGDMVRKLVTGLIKNAPEITKGIAKVQWALLKGVGKIGIALLRLSATLANNCWKAAMNIGKNFTFGVLSGLSGLYGKVAAKISGITKPIRDIVAKIKSYFPIKIGNIISKFKLPSIGVTWESYMDGKVKIPKFHWAAKGGIVDGATIIGAGEAGKEAIVPLDPFWERLENTKANQYNINVTVDAKDLQDLMTVDDFVSMLQRAKAFA